MGDAVFVSTYGSLKRTLSAQDTSEASGIGGRRSHHGSFTDLPMVAISGLSSRVSISGSTAASRDDLASFFHTQGAQVEAVRVEGGWTWALLLSGGTALLSALQFGYNNGNMNTQASVMRAALNIPSRTADTCESSQAFPANDSIWGFCVSVFCLSALIGSAEGGRLADRWGRRPFLLLNSVVYVVSGALEAASSLADCRGGSNPCAPEPCATGLLLLLLGRVVTGVACGASTVVVPMYLGEIAPPHLRGALGSAFLLTAVTGMLIAQLLGLPAALGTAAGWPWLLGAVALPALAQWLLAACLLESPRWLLNRGRYGSAQRNLAKLRGCEPDDDELAEELASMVPEGMSVPAGGGGVGLGSCRSLLDFEEEDESYTLRDLLGDRQVRWPLTVCVVLMGLQQFSGINNAFNYSSTFLEQSGLDPAVITLIAVAMNVGNVLIVLLSSLLMDRLGRRALLLLSVGGMALACALLTAALLSGNVPLVCVAVVLFVATFGLGLGPVTWLLPAELFPMKKRAAASGLATGVNWLANFVVGQAFLPCLAAPLGPLAFFPFCVVLSAGLVFVFRCVPETRGKTLEQIERELKMRAPSKRAPPKRGLRF